MKNEELSHNKTTATVACPHCGELHDEEKLEQYILNVGETPCCGQSIDLVETSSEEL